MLDSQTPFIENDCCLDDGFLWLLTGPNMAGKSTFLPGNSNAHIAKNGTGWSLIEAMPAERMIVA